MKSNPARLRFFRFNVLSTAVLAVIVGCGEAPQEEVAAVARPVKSMLVASPEGGSLRRFPGKIESANKADLSFRVAGKVEQLLVSEGETVKKSQLLAQLDKTDFQIALRDKQATYDKTKKNFARATDLVDKGAISRRDYDTIDANFKSADAALSQARENLGYTSLKAPFAGSVAKRHVENFEQVQAKQAVLSMIDESSLEVKFDIPESIILHMPQGDSQQRAQNVSVWASFDSVPGKRFELQQKEVSKRADAKTQTFEATFSLPAQKELIVLPGMTATVMVDLSKVLKKETVYYIPISAIAANGEMDARVWLVDEKTMTVHEQKVTLGRMLGSKAEVTEGVESGMRIVTAGAAYLAEGMKVTLMKQAEQAESREDDLSSAYQQ